MRIWRLIPYLYDRFYGYDVFISYSRRYSRNYALSLLRQLQALGLSCFLDERDIHAGAPLDSVIRTSLKRSAAVVPVIAKGTETSAYVPVEIAHALALEKQIIPISIADEIRADHWSSIQQFRWIDETEGAASSGTPASDVANQIRQSFAALRRIQIRRLTLGVAGLTLSLLGLLAYTSHREARLQESFGLYSQALGAAASKDKHAAKLYFASALERNDSPEIRHAMTSVLEGPRWRWDFTVPSDDDVDASGAKSDAATNIAFTQGPDASLLAIRGRRLFALEAGSGSLRRIYDFQRALTAIAVDGSSGSVAIGDTTGRISVFRDSDFGEPRALSVDGPVATLTFNSDGSLLGVGISGGGLRVLDVASGEQWYRSPSGQHEQTVRAIAFGARSSRMIWSMGRWLYASEPLADYIRLIRPQNDEIAAVVWDSKNDVVAAAGIDGPIQLVNLREKSQGPQQILSVQKRERPDLQELSGHRDGVTAMQLLGASGMLASAGYDGQLKFWNTNQNELAFSVIADAVAVADVAVSGDGALIAMASRDGRIRVWDVGTDFGKPLWTTRQLADNASFAAKSGGNSIDAIVDAGASTLLIGHASSSITAVEDGNSRSLVDLQQIRPRHDFLRASPDGRAVLSVSPAFGPDRFSSLDNTPLTLLRKTGTAWAASPVATDVTVIDAAWTYRPGTIAILAADKRLILGALENDTFSETSSTSIDGTSEPVRLATAAAVDVTAVAFRDGSIVTFDRGIRSDFKAQMPLRDVLLSRDGRYLAILGTGPRARTVVRDVARGETLVEVADWISGAAFDAASTMLLLGSDPRGELSLYDLRQRREQGRWLAHSGGVRVVAFGADGTMLYSAGNDGDVRSWPIAVLDEVRDTPARTVRENVEQATGLVLTRDGKIQSRPVARPAAASAARHEVAVAVAEIPERIRAARAVFATEDDDKEQRVASCGKLDAPDLAASGQTNLGVLAAAALCADLAGRTDDARSLYRSFYDAAVAQASVPGRPVVSPGLVRGATANLARSIPSNDAADLSNALQLINVVYLSSWRNGSTVRLPPTALVGDYVKALESISKPATLKVIDERANEFVVGLGPDWSKRTTSVGEAEVVSRLLFNLGIAHMAHDDLPGAYDLLRRAGGLVADVVGDLVMSGDPAEVQSRQFWTQVLAGTASLACHVVQQANDKQQNAVNGRSVRDLSAQAKESATGAIEQWKILEERDAQDDKTQRSMETLRSTLAWCAGLLD